MRIQISTEALTSKPQSRTQLFSLTCNPPAGTLPLAARVCRDISLHPRAMLDPPEARSGCSPATFAPELSVTATLNGRTTHLAGTPGCEWPGGAALGVYYEASRHDKDKFLAASEAQLHCDEDPKLLTRPTPNTLVLLCERGSGSSARVGVFLEVAEGAIGEPLPFTPKPGSQPCKIRAGVTSTRRIVARCSVSVKDIWSTPTVTLVESWPQHSGTAHHTWRVVVNEFGAKVVAQTGPVPPQLRH